MNFSDYETGVDSRIKDTANKLSQADKDDSITQAVKRYSKDRPREIVSDLAGAGSAYLALPQGQSTPPEQFEDGFSIVRTIEFPIGNLPPTYLDSEDWLMYRQPTGLKIALTSLMPQAADTLRVTWTVRHNQGSLATANPVVATTVPDSDFEAVCDLAASFACDKLSAVFARTNDSAIQADAVNYRTKSQEYAALSKAFKKRYNDHLGIEDGGSGAGPAPGAIAVGDMNLTQGSGVDRLTHRRPR